MANLNEIAQWEEGIYRIEQTDPVVGGEDGIDNIQAKQLGNRTLYLKEKLDGMQDTVESYSPEMQEALFAGLKLGLDLGALAMKEHEQTRLTRFQEIRATIKNRGIKSGVTLSKSSTATRNISCSDGVVFMNGREYPVANQTNTASVASNTMEKAGVVIIYMFLTEAGNTEATDPYLAKVTITDSARREPGWPNIQKSPAMVSVPLNRTLPDAEYLVNVEVVGSTGGRLQNGDVYATDKLKNGFKLTTSGTADSVDVRLLVSHPAM